MVLPAGQQRLQHAGGGRFADGDAARDADDERHRPVRVLLRLTEEVGGRREQCLPRRDLQMDQPGQRQVDLFDLEQVDLLAETPQPDQLVLGQLQRRRHSQCAPLTPVELHVRAGFAQPRHGHSLAVSVVAMEPGTLIHEYLMLGLRFDRVEEGYVDSFTGDPALRHAVEAEPGRTPPIWPVRPSGCWPNCPPGWTRRALRSSGRTCGRWRAPAANSRVRRSGSSTRCEAYFDVRIAKGDPERYRQAHAELDDALGGSGALAERMQAYRAAEEIPPARLEECIHAFSSALRDRVRADVPAARQRDHQLRGRHRQAVVRVQLLPR